MHMTRRTFLKSLAALAGVSVVPAIGVSLPGVQEPVKWTIDEFDWGYSFGVGAKWENGARHAVACYGVGHTKGKERDVLVEHCKQALRQWYYERHIQRKVA
jgi:hypothetical protein